MCDARRMLLCTLPVISVACKYRASPKLQTPRPARTSARRPLRFPEPLIFACPATSYAKMSIF